VTATVVTEGMTGDCGDEIKAILAQ
jgi:hypothetical protein